MSVEILMPELGESVHEGTVSRWLKKVGDSVKEDEPVVEIMTDKVNTELGAPATGILSQILIQEGGTVEVFKAMGLIEESTVGEKKESLSNPSESSVQLPSEERKPSLPVSTDTTELHSSLNDQKGNRIWFTPLVRSIAKQQGISNDELLAIKGSGQGGRVTKKDLEAYIHSDRQTSTLTSNVTQANVEAKPIPRSTGTSGEAELVPLVGMRKMIAEAMVRSNQVPTVSTVTQCDVTAMVNFRTINKEQFLQQHGVKLTYTPFFIKALAESLLEFPLVNSSLNSENQIVKNKNVNIGVAVALGAKGDEGLIVPVIRNCESKTLIELATALETIAKAARSNSLKPVDVQGGTFTITNPGTYGALFGTPMISAPQAGILGTYAINKMPVIVDDMIAIRSIMHLVLTYDHRLIDGLLAGKFLASVRDRLQSFDFFK